MSNRCCQQQGHSNFSLDFLCLNSSCKANSDQDTIENLQLRIQSLKFYNQINQQFVGGFNYEQNKNKQIQKLTDKLKQLQKKGKKKSKNSEVNNNSRLACVKCVIEKHSQHKNLLIYLPDFLKQNECQIQQIFNNSKESNLEERVQDYIQQFKQNLVSQQQLTLDQQGKNGYLQGLKFIEQMMLDKVMQQKRQINIKNQQAYTDQKEYIKSVQDSVKVYPELDKELEETFQKLLQNKEKKNVIEDLIKANLEKRKAYKNKLLIFLEKKKSFVQLSKEQSKDIHKNIKQEIQSIPGDISDNLRFIYIKDIIHPTNKSFSSNSHKFNFNTEQEHIISTQGVGIEDGSLKFDIVFSNLTFDKKKNKAQNVGLGFGGLAQQANAFGGHHIDMNEKGIFSEDNQSLSIDLIFKSPFLNSNNNNQQEVLYFSICRGQSQDHTYHMFRNLASDSFKLTCEIDYKNNLYQIQDSNNQFSVGGYLVKSTVEFQKLQQHGGGLFNYNQKAVTSKYKNKIPFFIELIARNCNNLDVEFATPLRASQYAKNDYTQFFKVRKNTEQNDMGDNIFGQNRFSPFGHNPNNYSEFINVMVQNQVKKFKIHYQMKVSQFLKIVINQSLDFQNIDVKKLYPNPQLAILNKQKFKLLKQSDKLEDYKDLIEQSGFNKPGNLFDQHNSVSQSQMILVNVDKKQV